MINERFEALVPRSRDALWIIHGHDSAEVDAALTSDSGPDKALTAKPG
jgi:hypothetical protein